jgi:Transposase DDE domain
MSPYVRTVKTSSGATAVQIVYSLRKGARSMVHIGSAHDEAELELLLAVARQRLAAGQDELDLGLPGNSATQPVRKPLPPKASAAPLPITGSRMGHLWDALEHGYRLLGFERAAGGDSVFRDLVVARIIEPASKMDTPRVLEEVGVACASYPTIKRRLAIYAQQEWRSRLARACAVHAGLGPATLCLYDVTTLYFETDTGDGFREPGFSKERRLEPQITVGLLTDATGFPLLVNAFEGNKAESATIVPVVQEFATLHGLADITVVADAGMMSDANVKAIEAAGLSFIIGARIPKEPYPVGVWRKDHPGQDFTDGQIFVQRWPAGPKDGRRDQMHYYQWKADRARRTLRGIDEQVAKAERAVAGDVPVKRNRFVQLDGGARTVNRDLEAKARSLAGLKGYVTNLTTRPDGGPLTAEFVIGSYSRLLQIEKSFRLSKHDLQARPIYHHKRESIEAHLTIVFAALAITRWVETTTGWSIRKFVRTARRYREIQISTGQHTFTAADPLPDDLRQALDRLHVGR